MCDPNVVGCENVECSDNMTCSCAPGYTDDMVLYIGKCEASERVRTSVLLASTMVNVVVLVVILGTVVRLRKMKSIQKMAIQRSSMYALFCMLANLVSNSSLLMSIKDFRVSYAALYLAMGLELIKQEQVM